MIHMQNVRTYQSVLVRRGTEDDMRLVMEIEDRAHEWDAWSEETMRKMLGRPDMHLRIASAFGRLLGFIVYRERRKKMRSIYDLAVDPSARRLLIGSQLVGHVQDGAEYVAVAVPDSNLTAQVFFKAMNFRAIEVKRRFFEEEDGYVMEWQRP